MPVVELLRPMCAPGPAEQIVPPPVIVYIFGKGTTFIGRVASQPGAIVYTIDVAPIVKPAARPVDVPIVATAVLVLLHEPPGTASENNEDDPRQMVALPVIGLGNGVTVIGKVAAHPVGRV